MASFAGQDGELAPLCVKAAALAIEQGRLTEANREFAEAESIVANGDYPRAREAARRAAKPTREFHYWKIREAYCQSLEALAALGMGDSDAAIKLIQEALKAVPKTVTRQFYFAPRILFAACRVEAQRGNHMAADRREQK